MSNFRMGQPGMVRRGGPGFGGAVGNPGSSGYVGPLDIAPGATVAYGHRALSTAMLGSPLYTIQRSSDSATRSFNSNATTGAAPTSTISSFIGGGTGAGTLWKDQSGNGNDVAQSVASNQPNWVASFGGISLPAFDFTVNTVSVLTTASNVTFATGEFTGFAVINMVNNQLGDELSGMNFEVPGAPGTNGWIAWELTVRIGVTNNYLCFIDISDGTNGQIVLDNNLAPSSFPLNSAVVYDAKVQQNAPLSGQDARFNGVSQTLDALTATTINSITGPFNVGSDDIAANSFECFNGQIAELILYPTVLSDSTRTAIRQNMASYYGITLS